MLIAMVALSAQPASPLPSDRLTFGGFVARFGADGTFALQGEGWPPFRGTWKRHGTLIDLLVPGAQDGCDKPGRYRFRVRDAQVSFDLVSDGCTPRRMILDRSTWVPVGERKTIPERHIVRTVLDATPLPKDAGTGPGHWPSFRGPQASGIAEGQHLPDTWDVKTGESILWRTPIAGLDRKSVV